MTPFLQGIDTEDDILTIRSEAMELLRNGSLTVTNWNSEGTSVSKYQGVKTETLIQWCNEFLQTLDPIKYGKRVTRTKPRFQ